jgi:hypothetical protein
VRKFIKGDREDLQGLELVPQNTLKFIKYILFDLEKFSTKILLALL